MVVSIPCSSPTGAETARNSVGTRPPLPQSLQNPPHTHTHTLSEGELLGFSSSPSPAFYFKHEMNDFCETGTLTPSY